MFRKSLILLFVLVAPTTNSGDAQISSSAFTAKSSAPDGELQFADLGRCALESGRVIDACRIGYRTFGTLNREHSNAILFPSWYNGTSNDLKQFFGPEQMVDTSRYFGIALDAFGNGISSSPSNSSSQKGADFPAFTIRDMVHAEYRVVTEVIHLQHVRAVMGVSMGGMQTFEWITTHPTFMDRAIAIAGTPQQTSYDLLNWDVLRMAIESDPAYNHGNYTKEPLLTLANEIGAMTAASPAFTVRTVPRSDADSFLSRSKNPIVTLDANNRIWQLRAIMAHDVTHGQGTLAQVAGRTPVKVLIIVATNDHLVNPAPALEWAKAAHAETFISTADCGHRIIICDGPRLTEDIRTFLAPP